MEARNVPKDRDEHLRRSSGDFPPLWPFPARPRLPPRVGRHHRGRDDRSGSRDDEENTWGGLIATWGVIVGACWVLALIWGVMGRGYNYPYAGLGPGIGIATASFLGNRRDSRAERKDSDTWSKSPDRHQ